MQIVSNENYEADLNLPDEGTLERRAINYFTEHGNDIYILEKALAFYGMYRTAQKMENECSCFRYYAEHFHKRFYEEIWHSLVEIYEAHCDFYAETN